jgi:predicted nucleic acid-binding protein
MKSEAFLDTNILIDALVPAHADHHARAVRLISKASHGDVILHLSVTVILEATFVLTRAYRVPRRDIANELTNLLHLNNLVIPDKPLIAATLRLWTEESPLSFADCYHLVLASSLGLDAIYSFDRKMGRYPRVERIEP